MRYNLKGVVMSENIIKELFADLGKNLPTIVFRNWKDWRKYIPYSPRYVANLDSLGTGPDEKVMVGGIAGYPKESLIRFLEDRATLIQRRGASHV